LNGLYLNLKGRETNGIVEPGSAADALMAEIRSKLLAVHDPKSQQQVITRIDLASEAYQGPYARSGPDMLVGYNRGYRAGWQTILGAFPPENSKTIPIPERDHCLITRVIPESAQQPQDRGPGTRFNRHCADNSRRVWNRQGTRYDWTIRVSAGRDPLIS
jgi:hypothetical protein